MLNIRSAAIAVITSASLSLLAMSAAQAHGGEKKPTHRAIYNTTRMPSTENRPNRQGMGGSNWKSRFQQEARTTTARKVAKTERESRNCGSPRRPSRPPRQGHLSPC